MIFIKIKCKVYFLNQFLFILFNKLYPSFILSLICNLSLVLTNIILLAARLVKILQNAMSCLVIWLTKLSKSIIILPEMIRAWFTWCLVRCMVKKWDLRQRGLGFNRITTNLAKNKLKEGRTVCKSVFLGTFQLGSQRFD